MKTYRFVFLLAIMSVMSIMTHASNVTTVVNAQIYLDGEKISDRYIRSVYNNLKVVAYVDGKECGRQETPELVPALTVSVFFFPVSVTIDEANLGKPIEMHVIVNAPENDGSWTSTGFAKVGDGEYIIRDVVLPSNDSGLIVKNGTYGSPEKQSFVTLNFVPPSVSLPDSINVNVGKTVDLLSKISYTPQNSSIPYNPSIKWDFANSADYITIKGNTLIAGEKETEEWGAWFGGSFEGFNLYVSSTAFISDPSLCKVYAMLWIDGEEVNWNNYGNYGLSAYVNGERVAGPDSIGFFPTGGLGPVLLKIKDAPKGNIEFRVSSKKWGIESYSSSEYIIQKASLVSDVGETTVFPFVGSKTYGSQNNPVNVYLVTPINVALTPEAITAYVDTPVSFSKTFDVSFLSDSGEPASIPSSYTAAWNVGNYVSFFTVSGDELTANQTFEKPLTIGAQISNKELGLSLFARISVTIEAKVVPVTNIAITKGNESHSLWVGERLGLTSKLYKISPEDATNQSVEWTSSDETIVKINYQATNNSFSAEALKPGKVTLTVTTKDGGKKAKMTVEVKRHVESFSLTASSLTMDKGATRLLDDLVKEVLPSDASDKRIGWRLTEGESGLALSESDDKWYVTANAVGSYTLTAYSVENPQLTQRLSVTVNAVVGGITVTNPVQSVYPGGAIDLSYKVDSSDEVSVEWTSSAKDVVSVNRGKDGKWTAKALKPGSAKLTVKTVPGDKTATISVTVWSHVESLTLTEQSLSLTKGQSVVLDGYVKIEPEDAHDKNVQWTTSDKNVATVSESDGVWSVTAVGGGEAVLKVVSVDNAQASASLTVKVTVPVTGITINKKYSSQTLWVGDNPLVLTSDMYTITPSDASDVSVKWSSADESVVSVSRETTNASWIATPKKVGNTTLTVATVDGGKKAKMTVEVKRHVESFILTASSLTMDKGATRLLDELVKEVLPSDASDKRIGWRLTEGESGLALSESDDKWYVTANAVGSYTLTAYSVENPQLTQRLSVTVNAVVGGITVTNPVQSVYPGGAIDLSYKVDSSDEVSVEWTSSAKDVVSVNRGKDGKWTAKALKPGSAKLTVKTVPGDKTATISVTVWSHVESLTLTEQSLSLTKGQSVVLDGYVKIEPEDAHDKSVQWTTSDKNVATVSESDGVWSVTAAGGGEAVLKVVSVDNAQASSSLTVKVTVPLTGLSFVKPEQTVYAGGTIDVSYTVTPAEATSFTVKLEYDKDVFSQLSGADAGILTVNSKAKAGTYTVKAVAYGNDGKTLGVEAVLKVTVKKHVEKIELMQTDLTLTVGDNTSLADYIKILPEDAEDKTYTVRSENESIVKIISDKKEYKANAIAVGETKLIITSKENSKIQATMNVKVVAAEIPLTALAFVHPEQIVYNGESVDVTWTPTPNDATSYVVKLEYDENVFFYDSDNTSGSGILNVSMQASAGNYTIKAKAYDLQGKELGVSTTLKVTVRTHVVGLSLTEQVLSLTKGMATVVDRYVRFTPEDAFDKRLRWTSSDESVASLSENGGYWSVTALSNGEAVLTVASLDNPQATAMMIVEVVVPLTDVSAVYPEQTVEISENVDLSCTFTPSDATNTSMTWTSSDVAVVEVSTTDNGSWIAVAKAFGKATLTGKSNYGGYITTITVTVPYHVTEINLTTSSITLKPSDMFNPDSYVQAVLPEEVDDKSLTWESSDANVVKLNGRTGAYTATAINVGEATLTARSNESPSVTATLKVSVIEDVIPLTGLAFINPSQTVYVGEIVNVTWTPTPVEANSYSVQLKYDKKVFEYKSNVMTVRSDVAAGDYMIIAQAYDTDGNEMKVSATLTVTVRTHVTGLSISDTLGDEPISVTKGTSTGLNDYVTVIPADAYNKSLTWKSSDTSVATVSEKNGEWSVMGVAVGETTLTVKSKDNPEASANLKVRVVEGVIPVKDFTLSTDYVWMTKNSSAETVVITPEPSGATVDMTKFSVMVNDIYSLGKAWKYLDVAVKKQDGNIKAIVNAAYTWGVNSFTIFYDDKEIGSVSVNVGAVMPFEKGWNWISTPYADYVTDGLNTIDLDVMDIVFGDNLQEVRANDALLYKDPIVGYFGDFEGLASARMYQFNYIQQPDALIIYNINKDMEAVTASASGWTWLAYPYEYEYTLDELSNANVFASAAEGDRIAVQDDFVEFTDGRWSGKLTSFQPSEGFMYYRKAESDAIVDWADYDVLGQKMSAQGGKQANDHRSASAIWNYNARAFADNMTIVAVIEGVDFPEDCSVGAFVNGECRGKGEYVDGRFFITVHGTVGESVSFVLYDGQMQTYWTVLGNLSFSDKAGSVKIPLRLKIGGQATQVEIAQAESKQEISVYDLQGRRVVEPVKGIYIINGEKNIK